MNFLPIFKYRLKDDLKAVGVFLLVTLLCMVLVIYGIMIMVSEIDDSVVSNFSIALTVFSFVIGIVTVREDLRLGIQNGVSRGTSLAACFTANVVASLAAALGVTLVEWLSVTTQSTTNAALVSFYAMIYGEDARLSKLWRWIVSLGMGAALILLLNATMIVGGFMDRVLAFFRWLGEAPVNLCICLVGVAIVFAVFDWLLTRKAPITAATA